MSAPECSTRPFEYEGKDLEAMDFAPNYHAWILSAFDRYIGQRLLEVGAGTGAVSRMLLERYRKETWLLEPSDMFLQLTRNLDSLAQQAPIHPLRGFLDQQIDHLRRQAIDTVFYINVMEHIEDDRAELARVASLLEPGGHVLTFSPALPWLYGAFDARVGHFRRYYLSEMTDKMRSVGLEVVRGHYFDMPGAILWWLRFRLFKKGKLRGKLVDLYDRLVIPALRYVEPSRFLPFGKNILVVGRKPMAATATQPIQRAA